MDPERDSEDHGAHLGELRSRLAQPNKDESWGKELLKLLERAREEAPEAYQDHWLEYLQSSTSLLPRPLCQVGSVRELERACVLLPWGTFRLDLDHLALEHPKDVLQDVRALSQSPAMRNLTSLTLHAHEIGDAGAQILASSPHAVNLTHLALSQCAIGGAGVQSLARSPHLANLTRLSLDYNVMGDEGPKALASSPHLTNLTVLSLGDNEIGDSGAEALARAPHLANLEELLLQNNWIGDEGVKAIAASPYMANLSVNLELYDNDFGEEGARALARSPHLPRYIRSRWGS